jgi:hypothetical protein
MSPKGLHAIENKDFYYVDSEDGDKVTSLVDGKECVFVFLIKIILQNVL